MSTVMPIAGRPAYYTIREAAWILGVEQAAVFRAIRRGTLHTMGRHGRLVISASVLVRLLGQPGGTP